MTAHAPSGDAAPGNALSLEQIRSVARRHRIHYESHSLTSSPVQERHSISAWEDEFVAFCRELVAGAAQEAAAAQAEALREILQHARQGGAHMAHVAEVASRALANSMKAP